MLRIGSQMADYLDIYDHEQGRTRYHLKTAVQPRLARHIYL